MTARKRLRLTDIKATLRVLQESGIKPVALETMPDGTCRWHFTRPPANDVDDLDRELQAFEAKHGYGRA